jgi:L-fucose mutarotase
MPATRGANRPGNLEKGEVRLTAAARPFLVNQAVTQDSDPMLKTSLTHPDILRVLARAGHHSRILIADGNYPASSKRGPNAEIVSLNLTPGIVTVAQVLRTLLAAVPVDNINIMGIPDDDPYAQKGEPPVWNEFRSVLAESGVKLPLESILKWEFYQHVESPDHVLTIQTADQSLWANVLLTMGCRTD